MKSSVRKRRVVCRLCGNVLGYLASAIGTGEGLNAYADFTCGNSFNATVKGVGCNILSITANALEPMAFLVTCACVILMNGMIGIKLIKYLLLCILTYR